MREVTGRYVTCELSFRKSSTDDGTCLANAVSTTYLNMVSKEYDDRTRIGYQYFGLQASGGYGQWPLTDLSTSGAMCDSYDPRFRPWYASTATGPKDVVLVLDKSGSMGGSRSRSRGGKSDK